MSDDELLAALTVLARRLRLLPDGKRLALVDEEVSIENALCLEPSPPDRHGVGLLCSYGKDHAGRCSWELGFIGISAADWPGRHESRFSARQHADAGAARCGFRVSDLPGALVCDLAAGHAGDHGAKLGEVFTAGTLRRDTDTADASRCTSTQPESGMRCIRQAGHDGEHRKLMRRWSDPDPSAACGAPAPLMGDPDCTLAAGHGGAHSNDPTQPPAHGGPHA